MGLSDSDREVSDLLERCLDAAEDGDTASIERLLEAHPGSASAVRSRLALLARAGLLTALPDRPRPPVRLGEFQILRELGHGGMGVVYLAVQESLGREVALKVLPRDRQASAAARSRFEREATAVARLHHPSIVQVHAYGEFDGAPYLVMERIEGATLAEVLEQLGGPAPVRRRADVLRDALSAALRAKRESVEPADAEVFHGSWSTAVASVARSIACAVQHAHERGVLHRDLKPSNVLLAADGSLRVIDFGLALAQGDQRLTRTGAALGSLPYMAPEQVRGDAAAIDARTDVYALGVLLHELLTLQLPFGEDGDTRERILRGDARPVLRTAGVHPDLAAVCRQAMHVEPSQRYASARELADDLGRFLDGQPVLARRPGPTALLQAWARRNPWRSLAAALAATLLVVGPTAFAIQERLAAGRIRDALMATEHERDIALRNIDRALTAVDLLVTRSAELDSGGGGRAGRVRRRLLEDSLRFLDGIIADAPESRRARFDLARARSRSGAIHLELGDSRTAQAALDQALSEFDALLSDADDRAGIRVERGRLQLTRAYAANLAGDAASQTAALELAVADFDVVAPFADLGWALAAAKAHLDRAVGRARRNDDGAAQTDLDAAAAILGDEAPSSARPDQLQDWTAMRATLEDARAMSAFHRGEFAVAAATLEAAIGWFEAATALDPTRPTIRDAFAGARARLALLAHEQRDWERSLPLLDAAIAMYEALVRAEPDDPAHRGLLATLVGSRATSLTYLGRLAEAQRDHENSLRELDAVVTRHPELRSMRRRRGMALGEFAMWLQHHGDLEAAHARFEAAIAEFRALSDDPSSDPAVVAPLAQTLAMGCDLALERGDLDTASAWIDEAVRLNGSLRGDSALRNRIDLLMIAARVAGRRGDWVDADRCYDLADQAAAELVAADRDDPNRRVVGLTLDVARAASLASRGEPATAATFLQPRLAEARGLATAGHPIAGRLLGRWMLLLAGFQRGAGRSDEARATFDAAVAETGITRDDVADAPELADLFGPWSSDR